MPKDLTMALRQSLLKLSSRASQPQISRCASASTSSWQQKRTLAREAKNPPVTQDTVGSKGPTAMVFMNMGGPSTTDEVGDFLSRLFVCSSKQFNSTTPKIDCLFTGRWRSNPSWPPTILPWSSHLPSPHSEDPEAIR